MSEREPDFAGVGRAWEMRMGPAARPDQDASIAGYVVNGPWHPLWSWWSVSVVHLRDLPGVPPANKHYPEAEYEFMIVSIDPQKATPDPDQSFPQDIGYLTPPDVVKQFHGVSDEQAKSICVDAVKVITAGQMSPDSDYRQAWNRAIDATVQHVPRRRALMSPSPSLPDVDGDPR